MLIKLCVGHYATHDRLFNGAYEVFQYVTKSQNNEFVVWIHFLILKHGLQLKYEIDICTQPTFMKHGHRYNQFLNRYKLEKIRFI
jgi:hypothetical protein